MEVKKVIVDNKEFDFIVDSNENDFYSDKLFLDDTIDLTDVVVDLKTIIEGSEFNE